MIFKTKLLSIPVFLLVLNIHLVAQNKSLPKSTPEKEGVSSRAILEFLDAAGKSNIEFHSFIMLRHGKVIAETWWKPYGPDLKHTMYSCSKSFTATAVGLAISEKLLSLDDKVISFFSADLPDTVSSFLSELTVKDVLTMSDGQDPDPTSAIIGRDSNWVKAFLNLPIINKPGTKFLYNSMGTYLLSAIVQKLTGQKVIDYLKPRLFEPLGIQGMDWEVDARGINTGGWGLRIKTEDMAKFGQLFLQKGKWNGKQILPAGWVDEASTIKILQHPDYSQAKRDSGDWEQGYGYQMWRCRHNGYRADGAFGQFIIVLPDEDAVVAITAETSNMQDEIDLVWQYLLPAMHKNKLAADDSTTVNFARKLSSLSLPVPAKMNSPLAVNISHKSFLIEPNDRHIKTLSFNFSDNECAVKLENDIASFQLIFGAGTWQPGYTTKHGPSLTGAAKASLTGLPEFKIAAAYTWKDDQTLELTLRYIESPHTEKMTCHFDGNTMIADIENSFDYGGKDTVLKGSMKE